MICEGLNASVVILNQGAIPERAILVAHTDDQDPISVLGFEQLTGNWTAHCFLETDIHAAIPTLVRHAQHGTFELCVPACDAEWIETAIPRDMGLIQ